MLLPEIYKGTKALIFDLDGTLADSLPTHINCWHKVCATFNYHFEERVMYELTGMPTRIFAEYVKSQSNCTLSIDEIIKLKQTYFYSMVSTIKPIEVMASFVKENYGKLPMSVGTGGGKKSSQMILEAIGLSKYFDIVVSADDVTSHKPEPETFLRCAELMSVEPSCCQVFEDGVKGMEAAIKAGMKLTDVRAFYNYGTPGQS